MIAKNQITLLGLFVLVTAIAVQVACLFAPEPIGVAVPLIIWFGLLVAVWPLAKAYRK